jgi:hypothetical protein
MCLGVTALLFLGIPISRAECSGLFCASVYVEQLYTYAGDSSFWLQTNGTETLLNCTADSGVYLRGAAASKELYATLLAAQLADKLVTVRIVEGSNPCAISYVTLNRQ